MANLDSEYTLKPLTQTDLHKNNETSYHSTNYKHKCLAREGPEQKKDERPFWQKQHLGTELAMPL